MLFVNSSRLTDTLLTLLTYPPKELRWLDPLWTFASQSFQELLKLLSIKSVLSIAYHPQTDGTMEQVNQEIEAYLSIYCSSHPEDWPNVIPILEFTHNNQRHADWLQTPFELLYGESPIAIPTTFEHMKYPLIEEWINGMIKDWEEALAAHKLARRQIADKKKIIYTLQEGWESMAWHPELENNLSQENGTKKRRAIWNWRSHWTSYIQTETPKRLENTQHFPCGITQTLPWNWNSWWKLYLISTETSRRTRSLWSWNNNQTSLMGMWLSINTLSNGRDTQLKKQCGNQNQIFPRIVTC